MKIIDDCTVRLSVRELVEFVLRSGDIDNRRVSPMAVDAMAMGAKAHRQIQESAGDEYEAEVPLLLSVPFEKATLDLQGRADGIIHGEKDGVPYVMIDEIKGVFRDIFMLEEPEKVHLAQAVCYAYIYALQNNLPDIRIRISYVQLAEETGNRKKTVVTNEVRYFESAYTFEEIKEKFDELVGLYEKWAVFLLEHRKERNESAKGFPFPFAYRPGQKKIVTQVYRTIEGEKNLFVQAPTGIGKTLSMLYPSTQAVGQGMANKIFYLTAKTVTGQVAEEGISLMYEKGLKFSFARIMAKEKMCPLEKCTCNPDACPYAKGHLDRVNEAVYDLITHESAITTEIIQTYAMKHQVCPFEFCLDVTYHVDVVICDYNYAFDPHAQLQRYFAGGASDDFVFLIDEAHNLVDRAREMYSATIVKEEFAAAKKLFPGQRTIKKWLDAIDLQFLEIKRETENVTCFTEETFPNALILSLQRLYEALMRYLDNHIGGEKNEDVLNFYFLVKDFLETYDALGEGYLTYASYQDDGTFYLKLFCINPAERLKEQLDTIRSTVFFSATFLPIHYYKMLLAGSTEEDAIYVDSPFDPDNRALLIAKDVSSKYTRRNQTEYERIATYLKTMVAGSKGNYLTFFPSHKYLEDVKRVLEKDNNEFDIVAQSPKMNEEERRNFLNLFSEKRDRSLLALAVMGGVFSEGIDLKEDALIGACVVGTGLPQVGVERELIKQYFDQIGENGFDFSYRFPGFNKVMQAAGRLIRTPEDTGIILLLDERFLFRDTLSLFPREWENFKPVTLDTVSDSIRLFWKLR